MAEPGPITAHVADQVRRLRGSKRWTAERLAKEMQANGIDWNRGVVTKLETGNRESVGVDELVVLAELFSVSPLWLMGIPSPEAPRADDGETARLVRAIAARFGIEDQ